MTAKNSPATTMKTVDSFALPSPHRPLSRPCYEKSTLSEEKVTDSTTIKPTRAAMHPLHHANQQPTTTITSVMSTSALSPATVVRIRRNAPATTVNLIASTTAGASDQTPLSSESRHEESPVVDGEKNAVESSFVDSPTWSLLLTLRKLLNSTNDFLTNS